jgi:hypothetical protein
MTHPVDQAVYQVNRQDQKLIDEGGMLERVWPKLSRTELKKIEHLAAQP